PGWSDRTYGECLRRAEAVLCEGGRVLVDANFRSGARRRPFFAAAVRLGVPVLFLVCEAPPAEVRRRLEARAGDASDADWEIYQRLAPGWEEPGPETAPFARRIDASGDSREVEERALAVLRGEGLAG
ncbi:MAG TPA: AAA family ATPase, partial [Gemmataceae bacterium]